MCLIFCYSSSVCYEHVIRGLIMFVLDDVYLCVCVCVSLCERVTFFTMLRCFKFTSYMSYLWRAFRNRIIFLVIILSLSSLLFFSNTPIRSFFPVGVAWLHKKMKLTVRHDLRCKAFNFFYLTFGKYFGKRV